MVSIETNPDLHNIILTPMFSVLLSYFQLTLTYCVCKYFILKSAGFYLQPDSVKFGVKIIHKDPEVVSAFCLNSSQETSIALATHKEVLELDISSLLHPPSWGDSDSEDEDGKGGEFIYIPESRKDLASAALGSSMSNTSQTGRGTTVVRYNKCSQVLHGICLTVICFTCVYCRGGKLRITW